MRCANGWAYLAATGTRRAMSRSCGIVEAWTLAARQTPSGSATPSTCSPSPPTRFTSPAKPDRVRPAKCRPHRVPRPRTGAARVAARLRPHRARPAPLGNGHDVRAGMAHHGWRQLVGSRRPGRGRRFRAVVLPLPGPHGQVVPLAELDDRVGPAVQAVTGSVAEQGYAGMWNVRATSRPRSATRSGQRSRTYRPSHPYPRPRSLLVFVCEPIHQHHAAERERAIIQATGSVLTGQPAQPLPVPRRLSRDACEAG